MQKLRQKYNLEALDMLAENEDMSKTICGCYPEIIVDALIELRERQKHLLERIEKLERGEQCEKK